MNWHRTGKTDRSSAIQKNGANREKTKKTLF